MVLDAQHQPILPEFGCDYFFSFSTYYPILPRAIGWGAMPSWPMMAYKAETQHLMVTLSSSHRLS